jgi:[acyl-carrier-protein] S-malonyltransferase
MGKTFYDEYSTAREVFEEADDVLHQPLTKLIFQGPSSDLTLTRVAQPAIFVVCAAIMKVLQQHFELPSPACTAGLSLGEYTALYAAGVLSFEETLSLVALRGKLMHEACDAQKSGMIAILGLSDEQAKAMVFDLKMPNDLWCANFNSIGQVVISGTEKGLLRLEEEAKKYGVRKTVRLDVHGGFHSGLMKSAQEGLEPVLRDMKFKESLCPIAMNVLGRFATSRPEICESLIKQVTSSVRWHECVTTCDNEQISCFLEIGCGKTLAAMNKRIGVKAPTVSIETVDCIPLLQPFITGS